ncbi:MAG: hypothetical protein HQL29_04525 [Candidatus Omnitrophica bacterium]|nr:hypothetical protein [Candidatus Omnitrophota bacterium]
MKIAIILAMIGSNLFSANGVMDNAGTDFLPRRVVIDKSLHLDLEEKIFAEEKISQEKMKAAPINWKEFVAEYESNSIFEKSV